MTKILRFRQAISPEEKKRRKIAQAIIENHALMVAQLWLTDPWLGEFLEKTTYGAVFPATHYTQHDVARLGTNKLWNVIFSCHPDVFQSIMSFTKDRQKMVAGALTGILRSHCVINRDECFFIVSCFPFNDEHDDPDEDDT